MSRGLQFRKRSLPKREDLARKEADDLKATEEDKRLEFVFRLMMRAYSDILIVRLSRAQFGIGEAATRTLLHKVREKIRGDVDGNKPYARAEQIARLRDTIEKLKTPKVRTVRGKEVELPLPAQSIMRAEELLADLEGNRAPIKIDVEHQLSVSLRAVLATMPPERYTQLLELARERKRLALLASRTVEEPKQ
jgi:hypothetical protein